MRKLYIVVAVCWCLLNILACDHANEGLFEGEPSLHFELGDIELDSMAFSFMNTSDNRIIVHLPVQLAGYASGEDRYFRLKIDEENTTAIAGQHYQPLEEQYILERETYSKDIPLTLLYSGDLDTVSVRLALILEPSEAFGEGIPYRQRVVIISSNLLPLIPDIYWTYYYKPYFGEYSKVKHRYILSVLKLNIQMNFEDPVAWSKVDQNLKKAYGQTMNNYFADKEIYDENKQRILPWIK